MEKISIKKNYLYQMIYQGITILTTLLTAPYAARVFERDGIGIQSYTGSIVSYFVIFAMLGTASYGQREIAKVRDDKKRYSRIFWEIEIVSIISTLICVLVWIGFCIVVNEYKVFFVVQTISIFAVLFDISWFFTGFENFRTIIVRNCAIKIVGIILLFACIHSKEDLILYIFMLSFIGLLSNVSMWISIRPYLVKVDIHSFRLKRHMKEIIIYFIPTIATSIYTTLDKTMIGAITKDMKQSGYYQQATDIAKMCISPILSLHTTVGARMSYLFSHNEKGKAKELTETVLKLTLFFAIALSFGISAISDNFVLWYYGEQYAECVGMIHILSFLIIIISVSHCYGCMYFTPAGLRGKSSKAIVIGAFVNMILNAFLIPFFAAYGAAFASVLAELTITGLYLYMSRNFFVITDIWRSLWRWMVSGIVMFVIVHEIGKMHTGSIIWTFVQIMIGIAVYFFVLLILNDQFLKKDLKQSWKRLK